MPFFPSHPDKSGPRTVFTRYPEIYRAWSEMSQALMNGPSPLSQGERELILAYAAGVAGCRFVFVAHREVAHAWGIEEGLLDRLLEDFDAAPVAPKLRALLAFVRKLMLTPVEVEQADVDAVLAAGWDEKALHDAVAVTGRAAFMQRLVQAHGFIPLSREEAVRRAGERVEKGYVELFPEFRRAR